MHSSIKYLTAVPFVAASLALAGATPAMAQAQAGLVNVNVSNVAVDIADFLDIDVDQVPVTVQVPVGIAANVCGVQVITILSGQITECEAENFSVALARFTQRQLNT